MFGKNERREVPPRRAFPTENWLKARVRRAAAFFKLFGGRAYRIFSAEKKKKKRKSATDFAQ